MKIFKKVLITSVSALFGFSLFACGQVQNSEDSNSTSTPASDTSTPSNSSTPSSASTPSSSVHTHSYQVDTTTYEDGFEWSTDHTTATLHVVCSEDATHTDTITATVSHTVAHEGATCTDDEVTTYTATAKLNGADVTSTPVDVTTKQALGHSYVVDTSTYSDGWEWAADASSAKLHLVCERDATHTHVVDADVTSAVTTSQSCTDGEVTTYTATASFEEYNSGTAVTSTKLVTTKQALGHSYVVDTTTYEDGWEWAADASSAKLHLVCEHDGAHTHVVDADVTSAVTTSQSCTDDEVTTYTATASWSEYNSGNDVTSTKLVTTKTALGHSVIFDTIVSVNIAGDATIQGTCSTCSQPVTKTVPAPTYAPLPLDWEDAETYFTVDSTSAKYTFVYDAESKTLKNNNQKKGGSANNAVLKLTALSDFDFVFDYYQFSEARYDYFYCEVNDTKQFDSYGLGTNTKPCEGTVTLTLHTNDVLEIIYTKDGSGDQGDDTATLSNFRISIDGLTAEDYAQYEFDCEIVNVVSTDLEGNNVYDQLVVLSGTKLETIDELEKDGLAFRGYFEEATYETEIDGSTKVEDTTTLYAKMRKKLTVTLHYSDGAEDTVLDEYAEGDTFAVPENPEHRDGTIFAGWFTTDGYDTVYEESTLEDDLHLYAKFTEAPWYVKSFAKTVEVYGSSVGHGFKGSASATTIDDTLTLKQGSSVKGVVVASSFDENGFGYMTNNSKEYGVFLFEDENMVIYNYSTTKNIGTDYYIAIDTEEEVTVDTNDNLHWDGGNSKLVTVHIGDTDKIIYSNSNTNEIYTNVSVTTLSGDPITIAELYVDSKLTQDITIKDADGSAIASFVILNNNYVELDGMQGTYTGELGEITLDGIGNVTIGEAETTYSFVDDHVEFEVEGRTRAVILGEGTYTTTTDGSEGTYIGDYGTVVSNGDGTATIDGAAATYTKNGMQLAITITDSGEEKKVLLVEGGTYLTSSIFANHTFTGSFYDGWMESTSSLKIIFDDSTGISGVLYAGYGTSYYFNFTGEFDEATAVLTLTITSAIDSSAVGKKITIHIEGNTMTITDCEISNQAYKFDNQGTLTSDTFTL